MNDACRWARAAEENGVGIEAISVLGPPLPRRPVQGNTNRPGLEARQSRKVVGRFSHGQSAANGLERWRNGKPAINR